MFSQQTLKASDLLLVAALPSVLADFYITRVDNTSQCTAAVECSSPATFGGSTVASNTFDCDSFIGGDFKEIGDAPPVCQTEEARDYTFGNGGTCANAGDNLQMVLRDGNTWNLYAAPVGSGDVDQGLLIGTCYTPNGCSPDNGGEPDGYDSTDCITGLGANALIDALYLCETESAGNPAQCI